MSFKLKNIRYPRIFILILSLAGIYLALLIPLENNSNFPEGNKNLFIWNRDSLWKSLESDFLRAGRDGCPKLKRRIDSLFENSEILLKEISKKKLHPSDQKFKALEDYIFHLAPLIPVCSQYFSDYINFCSDLRNAIKEQSVNWNNNSEESKSTLYRLLYGSRTAIEEIMLQLPKTQVPSLIRSKEEPSSAPSARMLDLDIHSGDILVSRGGAPTSALIARGNDYPGNFSHVALVHIDDESKSISVIESHIERGVTVSSLDEYLRDTKLRIMVLRLRSDLISRDPMLPHKAAELSLKRALEKHFPYDFEMNINESEKLFCSEVAYSAYIEYGIKLWARLSTISSIGTRNWLAAFGVKYFETQEPSDLEYDPQLSVVAEWRDPETLYKDHMDNAVTDIMLEAADSGKVLNFNWYLLPLGRILKLYSSLLNVFGTEGPVPEGMSAEAALKNISYSDMHEHIKSQLFLGAVQFKVDNGYNPPYWELVSLARQVGVE